MTEPLLTALLLLPRIQVQNANAISGPLTWGFPSPSAFLGFMHALERKFMGQISEGFLGIGIICHQFDPQISKGYTPTFCLTRNPVGKDGKPTALIEEGRAHFEVTLVIGVKDYKSTNAGKYFAEDVLSTIQGMRLAGGTILPIRHGRRYEAQWWQLPEDQEGKIDVFRILRRRLLPGFALVQREDILANRLTEMRLENTETNALDALLDLCRLNIEPNIENPDNPNELKWGVRKKQGWLVPLPVGYSALSPLYNKGEVMNTRDDNSPFRFVESIYSLGEWIGPHRIENLEQLLWQSEFDSPTETYRCINHYYKSSTASL